MNKKGLVTGLKKGTAKIRVTVNGIPVIVKVKVKKAKVKRVRRATVRRTTYTAPVVRRTTPSTPTRVKKKKFVPKH